MTAYYNFKTLPPPAGSGYGDSLISLPVEGAGCLFCVT